MIPISDLAIVIVNWNAGNQLADVVKSVALYHHDLVLTVIIVDNASSDDSLYQVNILKDLPFQIKVVHNSYNRGFGAACNQGAALTNCDYLLFLNPDTRLFDNSMLVPLAYLHDQNNHDVGIVGIQLLDDQKCIARSCARFPTLGMFAVQALGINRFQGLRHLSMHMMEWEHDETRVVDHVIGAFFLMRHSLFKSLRGFDERFFVYLEDLDLSLRARKAGYKSVYLSDSQAFHLGGGTSRQIKAQRLFYSLSSRLLFGFKHFSQSNAWGLLFITLTIELLNRLALALFKVSWRDASNTLQAYGYLLQSLPNLISLRRR